MALSHIKIQEQELTNGNLRFTAQISFKSEGQSVKLNHNLPTVEMAEDAPMTEFAEKIEALKETASVLAEKCKLENMAEIQKGLNSKLRKDYMKAEKELPMFS